MPKRRRDRRFTKDADSPAHYGISTISLLNT